MKKTVFLTIALTGLCLAWWLGWVYVTGKVENNLNSYQIRLAKQNRFVNCQEQAKSGFPFRISFTCERFGIFDAATEFEFSASAIRSAAQIYQPGKVIVEIEGPAKLNLPDHHRFDLDWTNMRGNLVFGFEGVERFSLQGRNTVIMTSSGEAETRHMLTDLQLHGRRIEKDSLDLAIEFRKPHPSADKKSGFDFSANVRFDDSYHTLGRWPDFLHLAREQGLSGKFQLLRYSLLAGGEIIVTGPFKINARGLLSGIFEIEVQNLVGLIANLQKTLPDQSVFWQQLNHAAFFFGATDDTEKLSVKVTVRDGKASIGLIPLGVIPNLF